jgi:hypothetical protein
LEASAASVHPDCGGDCTLARAVIANHHNLLLGLPGAGARLTATDRARLAALDDHRSDKGMP